MKNLLRVKDGDTVVILADVEPSVCDPLRVNPTVAMAFRVVANSSGPVLTLVPLANSAYKLSYTELRSYENSASA